MKRILIFLLVLCTLSCSVSDDSPSSSFEILPIESVDIPNEFIFGETYEITLTYIRPSNCHIFSDIYFVRNSNERTVAVINEIFNGNDCQDTNEELEASFDFQALIQGSVFFRFWQGTDNDGEDQYLEIEVPIIN